VKKPATDFLLIDVSNSFTKLAFASRSRIGRASKIATYTHLITADRITKILRGHDSATPGCLFGGAQKEPRDRTCRWQSQGDLADVAESIEYPHRLPQSEIDRRRSIGQCGGGGQALWNARDRDRFWYPAVTFDIVAPDNAYIGGVIAPGLEAMTNFLYDRTALLPRISLREPRSAIGKSTNQAMLSGAIFGYRGLVREILQRITAEKSWKDRVRIVATGGYAKLIAGKLPEVDAVHENLTLEGFAVGGLHEFPIGSRSEICFPNRKK